MQKEETPIKNPEIEELTENQQKSGKSWWSIEDFMKWWHSFRKDIVVFIRDLKRIRDILKNNYELGKKHYDLGNFEDAIMRFKFVTWMDPKQANAWYWLGASYLAVNKKPEARKALKKALEIKPDWQEGRDMLKAASGGG